MENKILNYINYLFKDAPKNQEMEEMKEEIYQNTLDKYNDLIINGKSKEDAYLIAISNIGNIEELFDKNETVKEENVSSNNIDKEEIEENAVINNEEEVEEPTKSRFNFLFILSIILYILSVIPEIILDDTPYEDTIGTGLMFLLIGVATILLVISQAKICKPSKSHNTLKTTITVVGVITLITYFLVSFLTMAWYITWIIFIIGEIVKKIIRLCFKKEGDNRK